MSVGISQKGEWDSCYMFSVILRFCLLMHIRVTSIDRKGRRILSSRNFEDCVDFIDRVKVVYIVSINELFMTVFNQSRMSGL